LPNNRVTLSFLFGVVFALAASALAIAGGPGFRSHHLLEEHYTKHGHEFGNVSQEQYLRMAQQLRDSRPGKNILETKRKNGAAKFDKRYGWFVAYDSDGTIRTFFIPNTGLRYFERQAKNYAEPK
jgi:pyocin large subunit-like protein